MRVVTARVMALRRWLISRLPEGAGLRVHAYKAYYLTEPEIRWAVSNVKAGDLVVDVGCNIGVYAFWLAKRVGKSGKVIALDPAPACVQYLRAAALQLGFDQLTVVDRGASDTRAVLELHIPIEQNEIRLSRATFGATVGPSQIVNVEVSPLDELLRDRDRPVSFIKCDVEGHELAVLRGARRVLDTDHPTLLVECEQRHLQHDMQITFDFLRSLGYEGSFLDRTGTPRPLYEFSPAAHQLRYVNQPAARGYINNFLFVHSNRPSKTSAGTLRHP